MDYEGTQYISEEGTFIFTVKDAEIKDSKAGNPMVVFTVQSDHGQATLYFPLTDKAKWKYNKFIKACLKFDTVEKYRNFELDYELIHNDLIGTKFLGTVECESYEKTVKVPTDDGRFETKIEDSISYKITDFDWIDED